VVWTLGRVSPGQTWRAAIDVAGCIRDNVTPYGDGPDFLTRPTRRTQIVWESLSAMFVDERRRGIYDVDTHTPSTITSHAPGYIDHDHELIVGLQTSAPLRRAIMPAGGLRVVEAGLKAYGNELDPAVRQSSPCTARPTTPESSTPTPPTCSPPDAATSSPACSIR
jgi:formate C-acetyltransferase